MKIVQRVVLLFVILCSSCIPAMAEYSRWSFGGGLAFVYNSDSAGVTSIEGIQEDGSPGGLGSAPSPIINFLEVEYRHSILPALDFAPSLSLVPLQYMLWENERALPAEIENRTAWVPALYLDLPFLYHFEKSKFTFAFGGGPSIYIRYGFLAPGVDADEQYEYEELNAAEQVAEINDYLWGDGRWFYPTVQTEFRYQLATGWGAGLTLRVGIPIFNLWAEPEVPFMDCFMALAAISITPPVKGRQTSSQSSAGDSE